MRPRDSKQAEKNYLRRSGGGTWEASKPFPPPGQVLTEEHAQHLLDFAVLLRVLTPAHSDLVLDLGAGPCWVSDWLRKCGIRTVAVDIAVDMLALGSVRLGSTSGLVAGDMEKLPFADQAFDKACCLNAFHHVPHPELALKEIRRVLKPDGVVFFSEPGRGHSSQPTSVAAAKNYGVLENEILIEDFMASCLAAGFADVRLRPISHIVPLFELERSQWLAWKTFTASQRPIRALDKLWRAVLEFVGLRKQDLLFEEAFAIRLLRELQPVIDEHPVVTAHVSRIVKPTKVVDHARVELLAAPTRVRPAEAMTIRLSVANTGTSSWNAADGQGEVRLGVQLLSGDGSIVDRDFARQPFPGPMPPGARCDLTVRCAAPMVGSYQLKIDVVREGVRWFEMDGSRPITHPVQVEG